MATWFRELAGSPKERFAEGGMAATRTFQCNWGERYAFVRDILGSGYGIGGTSGTNYPGNERVRPTKVESEPFTDDVQQQTLATLKDGPNTYASFAKVTVEYKTTVDKWPDASEIDLQERTWLTYRVSGAVEANVITADNHRWKGDGAKVTDPELTMMIRTPVVEHHLTWHNILLPPVAAIRANLGKVNSAVWHGFPTETMLFDTWSAEKEFALLDDNSEVITTWKLSYVFRERTVHIPVRPPMAAAAMGGWNDYYRTKPRASMGWEKLEDVNGNPAYPGTADFDKLFRYAETE